MPLASELCIGCHGQENPSPFFPFSNKRFDRLLKFHRGWMPKRPPPPWTALSLCQKRHNACPNPVRAMRLFHHTRPQKHDMHHGQLLQSAATTPDTDAGRYLRIERVGAAIGPRPASSRRVFHVDIFAWAHVDISVPTGSTHVLATRITAFGRTEGLPAVLLYCASRRDYASALHHSGPDLAGPGMVCVSHFGRACPASIPCTSKVTDLDCSLNS